MPSLNHDLRYGTDRHNRIRDAINARLRLSQNKMQDYYSRWEDAEKDHQIYIKETDADASRDDLRDDGHPQYTTLKIPYTYAVLMTAHTYDTSVFLSRSPIIQFEARHGEPYQAIQAVESLIDYQTQVGGMIVPWYVWLLDRRKYGVGFIGLHWDEEISYITTIQEEPVYYAQALFGDRFPIEGKTRKVRRTVRSTGYRGNRVFNIRPQDAFPDPRKPLSALQEGEFFGWRSDINWIELVEGEQSGRFINVKFLSRTVSETREDGWDDDRLPENREELNSDIDIGSVDTTELHTFVVKLIPKDWKLGTSDRPEMWMISLAGREVVVECRPLGALHGKFPIAVMEHEPDGHLFIKRSLAEIMQPLAQTMDWLINTHFFNVRKVLNDQFIVDPSLVVMKDLKDPNPGRLIRLRPKAYGRPELSKLAVQQLSVVDVTQNHLRDSEMISQLIQRVTGVTDNIMGMVNQGGRKTATEVRTSNTFGVNRLKTEDELASAQGWTPMAQMMLQNTQQYYDEEMTFRLAGDLLVPGAQEEIMVSPDLIQGFYNFVPVDGALPVDRYAQANLWGTLLNQLRQFPQILARYDMGGIFEWVAQLAGLKNVKQFRVEVVPDGALGADAAAGNVVSLSEVNRGSQQPGGSPGAPERTPEPNQIPGMGTTG